MQPPTTGDVYQGETGMIPGNLRAARDALHGSAMLRAAMGDDVVDHYARAAEVEIEEFERVVTDWEIARGFRTGVRVEGSERPAPRAPRDIFGQMKQGSCCL